MMNAHAAEHRLSKNAGPQRFRTINCHRAFVVEQNCGAQKTCKQKGTSLVESVHLPLPSYVESLKTSN